MAQLLDPLANPPIDGEDYNAYSARIDAGVPTADAQAQQDQAKQDAQDQFQRDQAATSKAYSSQGIASYTGSNGTIQALLDPKNFMPLSGDGSNGDVTYSTDGSPYRVKYAGLDQPKLVDPYTSEGGASTLTDNAGNTYLNSPGVPTRWTGTDPDVAAQKAADDAAAQAKAQHAALTTAITDESARVNFGKARLAEHQATLDANTAQLRSIPELASDDFDPDADDAASKLPQAFAPTDPALNERTGFFNGGGLTAGAIQARSDLSARQAQAQTLLTQRQQTQMQMDRVQALHDAAARRLDIASTARAALAEQGLKTAGVNLPGANDEAEFEAAQNGIDPAPTAAAATTPAATPAQVGAPAAPISSDAPLQRGDAVLHNGQPATVINAGTGAAGIRYDPDPTTGLAPEPRIVPLGQLQRPPAANTPAAQPSTSLPDSAQPVPSQTAPSADVSGQAQPAAPYTVAQDGSVQLDPTHPLASTLAAYKDGLLDDTAAKTLIPKAQAAEQAQAEQQRIAQENPAAWKAFVSGAAKGGGFLAASAPGAALGAEVGSFGGPLDPITIPAAAAIGGLITGGLGSLAVNKAMQALGQHSQTIQSFVDASRLHPNYDTAGNLVSFAAGLPKVASEALATGAEALANRTSGTAADILRGTAENYATSGGLTDTVGNLAQDASIRTAQGATAGQVATALAARVGGQAAANVAIDTAIKEGAKALGISDQGQTLSGAAQAAVIGALTAGHGIKIAGYDNTGVANIVNAGLIREQAGLSPTEGTLNADQIPPGTDDARVSALQNPLSKREAEVYDQFGQKLNQLRSEGKLPGGGTQDEIADVLSRATARQATSGAQPYGVTSVDVAPSGQSSPAPQVPVEDFGRSGAPLPITSGPNSASLSPVAEPPSPSSGQPASPGSPTPAGSPDLEGRSPSPVATGSPSSGQAQPSAQDASALDLPQQHAPSPSSVPPSSVAPASAPTASSGFSANSAGLEPASFSPASDLPRSANSQVTGTPGEPNGQAGATAGDLHDQLAQLVNSGAATDNPEGVPSLQFQVLQRLRDSGSTITPQTSQAVAAHIQDTLASLPPDTHRAALDQILRLHQPDLPEPEAASTSSGPPSPAAAPLSPAVRQAQDVIGKLEAIQAKKPLHGDQIPLLAKARQVVAQEQPATASGTPPPPPASSTATAPLKNGDPVLIQGRPGTVAQTQPGKPFALVRHPADPTNNLRAQTVRVPVADLQRPPAVTAGTQPITPEGKDAQRTLTRLKSLRNNGVELDWSHRRAEAAADLVRTQDLNRQVLGMHPQPVTDAGKLALRKLNVVQPRLHEINANQQREVHGYRVALEQDFTAQRKAIQAGETSTPAVTGAKAEPESTTPFTADHALATAKDQVHGNRAVLKALGVREVQFRRTTAGSGIEFGSDGSLRISPAKVAAAMTTVRDNQTKLGIKSTPEDWFSQVLAHESIHAADAAVARSKGQTIQQRYEALPTTAMPQGWEGAGREVYGKEWDALPDWARKAEFVRQVIEGKWTGKLTEALYKFIREAVDYLKRVGGFTDTDPRFQAHVGEVESRIEAAHANPPTAKPARTFKMPMTPGGISDTLDHIVEQGGIVSPNAAKAKPTFSKYAGDYDSAPSLGGFYHHAVYKAQGGMMPDRMAETLHENYGVGDGSVDGMWKAIGQAIDLRRKVSGRAQEQTTQQKQASNFDRDALTRATAKGKIAVNTAELSVGDHVQVGDQNLKVIGLDPDTLDLELEDHSKYGVQQVADNTALYVEKVTPAPGRTHLAAARPDPHTGSLFGADEPFDLRGEPLPNLERIQRARESQPSQPPAVPTLRFGEKGTGDLFQGEDQPFNLAGETAIDHGARQAAQERAEQATAAVNDQQDKAQGKLFAPEPTKLQFPANLYTSRSPNGRTGQLLRDAYANGEISHSPETGLWARGAKTAMVAHHLVDGHKEQTIAEARAELDNQKANLARNYAQAGSPKKLKDLLVEREAALKAREDALARFDDPSTTNDTLAAAEPEQTPDPTRAASIKELVDHALAPTSGGRKRYADFGAIDSAQVAHLKADTGLDFTGFRRNLDNFGVRHTWEEHGDPAAELARGNAPLTREDFEHLPEILANPDASILAGKNKTGQDVILSAKRVNGYYVVAEEVRTGLKVLSTTTLFKRQAGDESTLTPPPASGAAPEGSASSPTSGTLRSTARAMLRQMAEQYNFKHGGEPDQQAPVAGDYSLKDSAASVRKAIREKIATLRRAKQGVSADLTHWQTKLDGRGGFMSNLTPEQETEAVDALRALDQEHELGLKFGDNDTATLGAAKPAPAYSGLIDRAKAKASDVMAKGKLTDDLSANHDAVDTLANIDGRQARSSVQLDIADAADRAAAGPIVEAGGRRAQLTADLAKVKASPDKKLAAKYAPVYQHALDNLDRLQKASGGFRSLDAREDALAEAAGLPPQWQARTKHIYDDPLSPESTVVADKGFGATKGFKTAADAIAAGVDPGSTDLADLAGRRVYRNRQAINEKAYQDGLSTLKASDGKPMLSSVEEKSTTLNADGSISSKVKVPQGYKAVQAGGNVLVAHQEIAPLLEAQYGDSALRHHWLGNGALDFAALIKHGALGIDTFHGVQTAIRSLLGFQVGNVRRGLAALNFSDEDLDRAVAAGRISKADADATRAARHIDHGLDSAGLNVGRATDNLLEAARQANLIHRIPVLGHAASTVADFTFHQLQPAFMRLAGRVAYARNQKAFPELSEADLFRRSAKEVNEFYGNLGSQGVFKSKTMQDATRLLMFAPGFAEGRFRTEARAAGQAARVPLDGLQGKGWRVGMAAQALGSIILASIIGNQALNLFTRGKPTWENEEASHQWDAWIPGGAHGFFFSPLSIAAEYSYALIRYMQGGQSALDAAAHIASNKLSGTARALKDLFTGRDEKGQPYGSTAERLKAALLDLSPLPMQAGALLSKDPKSTFGYTPNKQSGSFEKQLFAATGMKLDNAPSPRSQMYQLAQPFRKAGGADEHAASKYTGLRQALDSKDRASVRDEIVTLLKTGETLKQIGQGVGFHRDGKTGTNVVEPEHFTGSKAGDYRMYKSLNDEQRATFRQAAKDHADAAQFFGKIAPALVESDGEIKRLVSQNAASARAQKGAAENPKTSAPAGTAPTSPRRRFSGGSGAKKYSMAALVNHPF